MNKFRNAIEEGKFAARALRHFYKCYRKWRDANPDEDVVYVYVGHPDMAAAIVKQSALWQRFAAWEKSQADAQRALDALAFSERLNPYVPHAGDVPVAPGLKMRIVPAGTANKPCDCPACAAARATREESKAYDA